MKGPNIVQTNGADQEEKHAEQPWETIQKPVPQQNLTNQPRYPSLQRRALDRLNL